MAAENSTTDDARVIVGKNGEMLKKKTTYPDGTATRVRFEERDGKKVRVAVKSGETING